MISFQDIWGFGVASIYTYTSQYFRLSFQKCYIFDVDYPLRVI
jgi:hypothetical protein